MKTSVESVLYPIGNTIEGDFIDFPNVISKTYLMPADLAGNAVKDFMDSIMDAGIEPASLPFFIVDEDEDGAVRMKLHVSVRQCDPKLSHGLHFDSYFGINHMAALSVAGSPEENMAEVYVQLFDYLEEHSLQAVTPVFHVLRGGQDNHYVILKIGYAEV
jgi:hypothetical protein